MFYSFIICQLQNKLTLVVIILAPLGINGLKDRVRNISAGKKQKSCKKLKFVKAKLDWCIAPEVGNFDALH